MNMPAKTGSKTKSKGGVKRHHDNEDYGLMMKMKRKKIMW